MNPTMNTSSTKPATMSDYRQRLLTVLLFIQQNLDEELPLESLARVAHFSPYHFHRIFRGMMGETVCEHIRRLRLERAAMHLVQTRRSVTRLAFEAGFESHEAFTRAFRAMFGMSPSDYRRQRREIVFGRAPSNVHFQREHRRFIFQIDKRGTRAMKQRTVEIAKMPPMRVAFVRHTGPYQECKAAWEKLCQWAGPRGLLRPGARYFGLSYDDPEVTPPDKIRYDACLTVDNSVKAVGEIGVQTIGGGEFAMTTHFGPYDHLNETYAFLCGQWAPRSGRELGAAPCIEEYMNDPDSTEPADLVTDVYVPLAAK